jgi:hypothetical protein
LFYVSFLNTTFPPTHRTSWVCTKYRRDPGKVFTVFRNLVFIRSQIKLLVQFLMCHIYMEKKRKKFASMCKDITAAVRVRSRVWLSGICGGQSVAGGDFSEYFGFPCQSSFHQILHRHNHPGQVQQANQWPPCRVDTAGLHFPLSEFKFKCIRRNLCGIMRNCGLFYGSLPTEYVISVRLREKKLSHYTLSSGEQEMTLKIYEVKVQIQWT